jgi:hypothetical protein
MGIAIRLRQHHAVSEPTPTTARALPALDLAAPTEVSVATFSMG